MNYLTLETNSLVDLVGRNTKNSIDWEKIGTNAKAINLSPINNTITNKDTKVTIYFLPVVDKTKAEVFIQECTTYEVIASIITKEEVDVIIADNTVVE